LGRGRGKKVCNEMRTISETGHMGLEIIKIEENESTWVIG